MCRHSSTRLNWNNGGYGSWVTFGTSGHAAGDTYAVALQVSSAVSATGNYPWEMQVKASFSDNSTLTRTVSAKLPVVVQGSDDPFGQGWSIAGLDKLVTSGSDVVWVYGAGGVRFFESLGSGTEQFRHRREVPIIFSTVAN